MHTLQTNWIKLDHYQLTKAVSCDNSNNIMFTVGYERKKMQIAFLNSKALVTRKSLH